MFQIDFKYLALVVMICLTFLLFSSRLISTIDKRLSNIKINLPNNRYYLTPNGKILTKHKLRQNDHSIEGFEAIVSDQSAGSATLAPVTSTTTTTTPHSVESVTSLTSSTSTIPIPVRSATTSTPVSSATSLSMKLPVSTQSEAIIPPALQPTQTSQTLSKQTELADPAETVDKGANGQRYVNPQVCKKGQKKLYVDASNKQCWWGDRSLYKSDGVKSCSWFDRPMYVANEPKCGIDEKMKYDRDSPENMRMELEQIELRRNEISQKLNIPFDFSTGVKVGCRTDSDCNKFSMDPDQKQNVCKSDNTCYCSKGNSGTFCEHRSNYKDIKDMSKAERERFKNQNDLSDLTVRDYYMWLLLYTNDQWSLSDDHQKNLKRFLNGDTVSKAMIPRQRLSPQPSSQEYYKRLTGNASIQGVNFDTAGPYAAYNDNRYGIWAPPDALGNIRIVNDDILVKVNAKELDDIIRPAIASDAEANSKDRL